MADNEFIVEPSEFCRVHVSAPMSCAGRTGEAGRPGHSRGVQGNPTDHSLDSDSQRNADQPTSREFPTGSLSATAQVLRSFKENALSLATEVEASCKVA